MVQTAGVLAYRRLLFSQNGYLGSRLCLFWNFFSFSVISGKRWGWLSSQNAQRYRLTRSWSLKRFPSKSHSYGCNKLSQSLRLWFRQFDSKSFSRTERRFRKAFSLYCWWKSILLLNSQASLFQRIQRCRSSITEPVRNYGELRVVQRKKDG